LERALKPAETSALVYEVEKIHHGTPSGIDNTVIAYEQPVYFVRGAPTGPVPLSVGAPFLLLVGDTGRPSPTKQLVSFVRARRKQDREQVDAIIDRIGAIARQARDAIEAGQVEALGPLMTENHRLLAELGVSSPPLDTLVAAACQAGALGAKLSGAGQGGNMVALVPPDVEGAVARALRQAGAARVLQTAVE
jgi:mevalonate kinase